jgi:DNA-directed RNA polymerase specialized sigma24 family protein
VNPVLAFAIEHQADARAIIGYRYELRKDQIDEVSQDILIRIWRADPQAVINLRGYWQKVVRTAAMGFLRRKARTRLTRQLVSEYEEGVLDAEISADPKQDPFLAATCRESIREAWGEATDAERRSIVENLTVPHSPPIRVRASLSRLRRRLRERAAA